MNRRSLALAAEYDCKSVAFPLISAGVYGYPKDQALRVAVDTIRACLAEQGSTQQMQQEMQAYIVLFDQANFENAKRMFPEITV